MLRRGQCGAKDGFTSLSMVHKYSKGARQKRLAKEAQSLRERIINVGNLSEKLENRPVFDWCVKVT